MIRVQSTACTSMSVYLQVDHVFVGRPLVCVAVLINSQMSRFLISSPPFSQLFRTAKYPLQVSATYPLWPNAHAYSQSTAAPSEEDLASARKWLAEFTSKTLPSNIGHVTFSRSSGPGGQNVNKWRSRRPLSASIDFSTESTQRRTSESLWNCYSRTYLQSSTPLFSHHASTPRNRAAC